MKRLDTYIVREMLVPFLIGTLTIALMFQANYLIALFKELQISNVPAGAIAQLILFKTPNYLQMTLPAGMALASSLAIARLTRETELTAMRSAGVSIARVVIPVMSIGALVAVGNYFLVERVMPPSERAARKLANEVGVLALSPQFKSNVVVNLKNFVASFGSVSRGQGSAVNLSDILLIERRPTGETVLITAPQGTYAEGLWTIKKPFVRVLNGEDLVSAKSDDDLAINERISVPDLFLAPQPEEQTADDLHKAIAQAKKVRQDTAALEVALHVKYSVPASCLVFSLTGAVLAILFSRSGPFVGVLLSIFLVLLYYNAYVIFTQIIGRNGWLSPMLSAWMPNIIFGVVGLFVLRKLE